jgi:anti-repressor protein
MTVKEDRPGIETEATGQLGTAADHCTAGVLDYGDLQPFEFQSQPVRVVVIDGEPWFVLTDLCRVLGLARGAAQVSERLDDGVRQTYPIFDSCGRMQNAIIVSEPGMYEVVFRSDKPEAVAFRRWVTNEVLPQLRRSGSYGQPVVQRLTPLEYARCLVDAEERAEVEAKARAEAEARAKELEAPAAAWTELADAAGDYGVADAAKVLSRDTNISIGRDRLFSFMEAEGWIYRGRKRCWRAYQTQVDCGRLVEKVGKPYWHPRRGEYVAPEPTVRVTPKGLAELHKRLGGSGQLVSAAAS